MTNASPLLASRPVVSVGGQDNQPLSSGLLHLSIVETLNGIYRCEATFANWGPVGNTIGYLYFDRRTLDFGKVFQIKLNAGLLFDGRITALEARFGGDGAPEIMVRAKDRFEDLRMARRDADMLELVLGSALREFTVNADLDAQCTSLFVTGWDPASKSPIAQEATESAIGSELDGGESGSSILSSAFGERAETLAGTFPLDGPEAQARAEAEFRMRARRFVTGRGVADTNSLLRAGASVDLQGLGPLFSGKYYVTEVHHIFDPITGMRTGFVVQRPGLGRP